MSDDVTEDDADTVAEYAITSELREMLDCGLAKTSCYRLVEVIKELALIAVRQKLSGSRPSHDT